jgi:hypothetical protein
MTIPCVLKRIIFTLMQASMLARYGLSIADPLVVNPPEVEAGTVATVSGSGIQPGAKVLVWGGSSLVSKVNLVGNALDVAVSGNYAYVAADSAGVHVVNITDPRNPGLVTTVATNGNARSIHISGDYAYVGGGTGGLEIIDISNPTSPVLLSSSQTGSVTGVSVSASYAYVANGQQQIIPARLGDLDSLVLYVPLNDRINGGVGTNIDVAVGPGNLQLAEIDAGNLVVPSITYSVENNFGSNGGTMVFPGGATDGPLITGDREDYKALLNFGDKPAIISFWLDNDTSLTDGGTIVSSGPNGSRSLGSGGWSVYTGSGNGKIRFVVARKNHPTGPDCRSISNLGSIPPVTDGNRHQVIIVYDPQNEISFVYTDGIKGTVADLAGCRADTEGDDSGTAPGKDADWFTIGEAGQVYNGHLFYSGSIQDLYILTPQSVPDDIDAIAEEWYTLGMPGPMAASKL